VSWQDYGPDLVGAEAGNTTVLASDGERDDAVRVLNAAFAEGRLTADEHGERVRSTYAARTWRDLDRVTADLPGPPNVPGQAAQGVPGDLDRCLLCALLICFPPAGIAWLLAARHRARTGQHHTLAVAPSAAAGGTAALPGAGPRAENR
jgi:Domain of unknown function (DUF1707)